MNTGRKRSPLAYIPGYTNNAVLQLIIALAVIYVMLSLTWAVMMLVYQSNDNFQLYFIPNLALSSTSMLSGHVWTLLTYGWLQYPHAFMEMLSNMLWLYCFASVVQTLIGHRQIIPLFAYSLLAGGVFYLLAQYLPGEWGKHPPYILGPRAGLVGMAAASITLSPKYRLYFTDYFSLPLLGVAGIFLVLMLIGSGFYLPVVCMLAGGALAGFAYIKLLQSGYRPGEWMYRLSSKIAGSVTPREARNTGSGRRGNILSTMNEGRGISQKRIDEILDKINQKGYDSLTKEEKEMLMRAGKDE